MVLRRFLAAVLALPLTAGCGPSDPPEELPRTAATAPVRDVHVAPVTEVVWERLLQVTGELVAAEESTLSSKVSGRIESLAVDIGTQVRKDETLARIEPRDYELRLAQAAANVQAVRALLGMDPAGEGGEIDPDQMAVVREARAELDQARREVERQTSLETHGAATRSALDLATTELNSAESRWQAAKELIQNRRATLTLREVEFEQAKQALADTAVRAPFDGVVAERLAGIGDFVSPGAPLARLLRVDPVRLRLRVPELHAGQLKLGQELRVRFDSGAESRTASIARFAPDLGQRDRTQLVEADLANPDLGLRPGAFARAAIVLDPDARTLVIPPAALVRFAGIDKVFVADGEVAREVRVVVGRVEESRVEVLEGLEPGAQVVLEPGKLQGGARIRVLVKD